MSNVDGESGMRNLTDKATYERLEKDVAAVKNDISALTEQITDALNTFKGTATRQARQGYKQARSNLDSVMSDVQDRSSAAEDVIRQRPLATVGVALGLGFLIGVTWRR